VGFAKLVQYPEISMPEEFVALNCRNCGAKLQVYPDMDRFACSYCGTEMVVQRRGGTVALKAVEQAIQRVQKGTDKTAAELALVRLGAEQEALLQRHEQLQSVKRNSGAAGCGILMLMLGTPFIIVHWAFSGFALSYLITLAILLAIGIPLIVYGEATAPPPEAKELEAQLTLVRQRIAQNRRLLDS
jgi:hypothetical protein